MAEVVNLFIDQNTDFVTEFQIAIDESDEDISSLGMQAFSAVRKIHDSAVVLRPICNIEDDRVFMILKADDTRNLKPGKYTYDIELVSPAGDITRVVQGSFFIDGAITQSYTSKTQDIDASGPFSERTLYDNSLTGFSFLSEDTGVLYFMSEDGWSTGVPYIGTQLPVGGNKGDILIKKSNDDLDLEWASGPVVRSSNRSIEDIIAITRLDFNQLNERPYNTLYLIIDEGTYHYEGDI